MLLQRVEVIKCLENNETQTSLAVKFNIGQAVILRIKHDKRRDSGVMAKKCQSGSQKAELFTTRKQKRVCSVL